MGRPPRRINLVQRRQELEAELERVRQAEEREREQKALVIGRVALTLMEREEGFNEMMQGHLEQHVTDNDERALVGLRRRRGRARRSEAQAATAASGEADGYQ